MTQLPILGFAAGQTRTSTKVEMRQISVFQTSVQCVASTRPILQPTISSWVGENTSQELCSSHKHAVLMIHIKPKAEPRRGAFAATAAHPIRYSVIQGTRTLRIREGVDEPGHDAGAILLVSLVHYEPSVFVNGRRNFDPGGSAFPQFNLVALGGMEILGKVDGNFPQLPSAQKPSASRSARVPLFRTTLILQSLFQRSSSCLGARTLVFDALASIDTNRTIGGIHHTM